MKRLILLAVLLTFSFNALSTETRAQRKALPFEKETISLSDPETSSYSVTLKKHLRKSNALRNETFSISEKIYNSFSKLLKNLPQDEVLYIYVEGLRRHGQSLKLKKKEEKRIIEESLIWIGKKNKTLQINMIPQGILSLFPSKKIVMS